MRYGEAVTYQGDTKGWKIAEERMIKRESIRGNSIGGKSKLPAAEIKSEADECGIFEGELILVNQQHPYRTGEKAGLVTVQRNGSVLLNRRAAVSLFRLIGEINGWNEITAVSGWRSMAEQQEIWDKSIIDSGIEFTEKYVAVPGHSEHQTGLAVDLGKMAENIDFIRPDFPYSGICQIFRQRMARFGFIERYPEGKEKITGIAHEPWHFRYVGTPHAQIMTERGLTLEEYHEFLRSCPWGERPLILESDEKGFSSKSDKTFKNMRRIERNPFDQAALNDRSVGRKKYEISWLGAEMKTDKNFVKIWNKMKRDPDVSCKISGNNVDGFIVTVGRSLPQF